MCKDVHIIYFKGRNFRDFGLFSRKLLPGKKLEEKFAKVIFAKKNYSKTRESFFQVWKIENKKGKQRKV